MFDNFKALKYNRREGHISKTNKQFANSLQTTSVYVNIPPTMHVYKHPLGASVNSNKQTNSLQTNARKTRCARVCTVLNILHSQLGTHGHVQYHVQHVHVHVHVELYVRRPCVLVLHTLTVVYADVHFVRT